MGQCPVRLALGTTLDRGPNAVRTQPRSTRLPRSFRPIPKRSRHPVHHMHVVQGARYRPRSPGGPARRPHPFATPRSFLVRPCTVSNCGPFSPVVHARARVHPPRGKGGAATSAPETCASVRVSISRRFSNQLRAENPRPCKRIVLRLDTDKRQ